MQAIVDAETWDGAQLTLVRNRLSRPDIQKRPYLLRGLMKCKHCGLTYVGTVSQGKEATRLNDVERENSEVRGKFQVRPYYMCNGRNLGHRVHGPDALHCPSGHIRAKELEELVWGEIETMQQKRRGGESATFTPYLLVDEFVIHRRGFPRQAADKTDSFHARAPELIKVP
ncbi:MAG: hypothetical protein EON58_21025 [Alphaproteobacteria bacterium]|nr:MAG: hypothetical protein EON58_21025 [Alphaproteobacteria bacterium]